ncbi:chromate transporter [Methylovirgula sp. HY1]|uniref:chromate transporter n=1 Tax=Methylovirgula sp. HY1 TaxID=2822761 RepID=UPI001C5BD737|nr:chromate transporter [Methylovirgula sp. HY1]QXX73918.1 putative chromate transport protein [Methylovirgula sp. HY1]
MRSKEVHLADREVTRSALFLAFLKIGLCGFGGVATWTRRVIVEERTWLSEQDYAELLGVASILPGGNTVNISVLLGDRYRGISGSLCALAGLLFMPVVILVAIAALYDRFAVQTDVRNAVAGAAAATAGLVIGTGLKMMRNLRPDGLALVSGGAIFLAVGLLHVSLALALLVAVAVGMVFRAVIERRR